MSRLSDLTNETAVANSGGAMEVDTISKNRRSPKSLMSRRMNNLFIGFIVGILLPLLYAFTVANYIPKNSTAEVEQTQGCYIFVDCKPVMEYEYLGTVKVSMSLLGSGQYQDVRDKLIKKAKKDYPQADGLLLILKMVGQINVMQ